MQIEEEHIRFIENSLKLYGINSQDLKEDLVDHICSYIESRESNNFNELYKEAIQKFGGYSSFQNLQLETNFQKFSKKAKVVNVLKFIVGLIMVILLVIGFLFKIMHWPYANAMLIVAILLFAFLLIPLLFYSKHKKIRYKFS
ncbi:GldL-related protein [Lacinutrix venerupis]|uniref:Gliding motility protein GldL-like N-terminal domain-containing protein n=1 Tax=Lacinutrix venerupis TaxID=1486034 RepID=A0AAC9LL59_9FLAO|nr:hypothetical protein [Lacinutrix venerupis]APX98801.1 hypothetical protein BWR22_00260 [Lacinutrix venerupis]